MRIGINTAQFPNHFSTEEMMRLLSEHGISSIDLDMTWMLPWSNIRNGIVTSYEKMTDDELFQVVEPYLTYANKYGLVIGQAHALDPAFVNEKPGDDRLLAMVKRQIKLCQRLNCPYLIIHPAHCEYPDQITPEEDDEATLKLFGELIPDIKAAGITVCLENMYTEYRGKSYSSCCETVEEARYLVDELNKMANQECFGFCVDTGHALMNSTHSEDFIRALGSRIKTLHLNDNDGFHDQHLIPYAGRVHWQQVCDALKEIHYDGILNFELYTKYFEKDMYPSLVEYIANTGRCFSKRIKEGRNA